MMAGCALNIGAIRMVNSQNTEEIIAVITTEIGEEAKTLDKQENKQTGRSELQEKMEVKINEVWPYGHGPLMYQCVEFFNVKRMSLQKNKERI